MFLKINLNKNVLSVKEPQPPKIFMGAKPL